MFETYILALTTFFATIGPIDIAIVYAGLTSGSSAKAKKKMAIKGVFIATGLLLLFALLGAKITNLTGNYITRIKNGRWNTTITDSH